MSQTQFRQRRSASCSSGRRADGSAATPTLDLHGLRREEALSRLTSFLSDARDGRLQLRRVGTREMGLKEGVSGGKGCPVWVTVVTGSGSHSAIGAFGGLRVWAAPFGGLSILTSDVCMSTATHCICRRCRSWVLG